MNKWIRRLLFSFQFMTRYPINIQLDIQSDDSPRMSMFFPIVGLCVGAFCALLGVLGLMLKSNMLCAALILLGNVLITGAFHLDGCGDMFDALGSSKSREKMLEIMKDSRMGTMGVTAIIFDLGLKFIMLTELLNRAYGNAFIYASFLALAMPIAGKLAICFGGAIGKSARKDGLGKPFIDEMNYVDMLKGYIIGAILLLPLIGIWGTLIVIAAEIIVISLVCRSVSKALGGITGDTLGLFNQIGELVFLAIMMAIGVK